MGSCELHLLLVVMFSIATRGLKQSVSYEVTDEARPGTFVGNIPVDAQLSDVYDSSVLSQLRYKFLSPNVYSQLFSLDMTSGILETAQRLDRDVIEICIGKQSCVFTLDIAVEPVAFFRVIKVHMRILDQNDNAPMFTPSYKQYKISEMTVPGILFPLDPAKDPDSPDYGVDRYEVVGGIGMFGLRTETTEEGTMDIKLVLNGQLDREKKDKYKFQVVAYDRGTPPLSGSVSIEVVILDVNDNRPQFDNDTYVIRLLEDMPVDKVVVKIHASDPDLGLNGDVRYAFSSRTTRLLGSVFAINIETGEIVLRSALDFEKVNTYVLEVVAKDRGTDAIAASTKVHIHVVDVNDHSPQISIPSALGKDSVEIQEHSPLRKFVAHISVTDEDQGDNGKVNCSLSDTNFQLMREYSNEYLVVTASELDRERTQEYTLQILCRDHGTPERSTSVNMTVIVTDINDHHPVFTEQTYTASLEENSRVETYIIKVVATDADAGPNGDVVYHLDDDAQNMFSIGQHSGIITAAVAFDREQVQTLEFHVIASDRGAEPKSAMATMLLTITDTNDQRPRFREPKYTFNISENMPAKTRIGKVSAKDADLSPHNEFSFYIDTQSHSDNAFSINPTTGVIVTETRLDCEQKSSYSLVIVAKSNELPHASDRATVIVRVDDKNDNTPVISYPYKGNNTVYLSNKIPKGYVVIQVIAYDRDSGANGALTYGISQGNENGEFIILPNNGKVVVDQELTQFESKVFMLDFVVNDNGPGRKMTGATLNIVVNKSTPLPISPVTPSPNRKSSLGTTNTVVIVTVVLVLVIIVLMMIVIVCVIKNRKKWPRASAVHYPTMQIIPNKAPSDASGGSGVMHDGEVMTLTKDSDIKDPMTDDREIALMFSPENTAYRNIGVSWFCPEVSNNPPMVATFVWCMLYVKWWQNYDNYKNKPAQVESSSSDPFCSPKFETNIGTRVFLVVAPTLESTVS